MKRRRSHTSDPGRGREFVAALNGSRLLATPTPPPSSAPATAALTAASDRPDAPSRADTHPPDAATMYAEASPGTHDDAVTQLNDLVRNSLLLPCPTQVSSPALHPTTAKLSGSGTSVPHLPTVIVLPPAPPDLGVEYRTVA